MRHQKPFPANTEERMEKLLASSSSVGEYRRIQSIYFREKYAYKAEQIADMVGLKTQTVRNIHYAYLNKGEASLKLSGKGGRRRFYLTTDKEVSFLSDFEKEGKAGNILEISKIHAAHQKKVGKKIRLSTTYRLLHRHGWRKVIPRPKHPQNDKKAMAGFKKGLSEFIEKAKKKALGLGLSFRLMFQDEARFGRINNPRKCWAPKGYRPEVKKQIVREYTYAYGAVSPFDGNADFLVLPYMTAKLMNIFLEEIAKRHEDEFILMICDKAPSHKESALKIPQNIMIEPLPPYCPQINPTENIWDEVREKFFPNLTFDSMDAVESKLVEAVLHLENNPKTVKSITGFDWIINTS